MIGKRIRFKDGSYTLSQDVNGSKLVHKFLGNEKTEGEIIEEGKFPKDIKIKGKYINNNKYKVLGDDGMWHYCDEYNFEILN